MSGPMFYCSWWKCRGTKLVPHEQRECPYLKSRVRAGSQHKSTPHA